MSGPVLGLGLLIAALAAVNFYRVARGPTVYDRLLAVGVTGTKAVLLLVVVGFLFGRISLFVDLALVYALLNFVGMVAVAKFLEPRPEGTE